MFLYLVVKYLNKQRERMDCRHLSASDALTSPTPPPSLSESNVEDAAAAASKSALLAESASLIVPSHKVNAHFKVSNNIKERKG